MILGAEAFNELLRKVPDLLVLGLILTKPRRRRLAICPIDRDGEILEVVARPVDEASWFLCDPAPRTVPAISARADLPEPFWPMIDTRP